jgi:hypothetical protein
MFTISHRGISVNINMVRFVSTDMTFNMNNADPLSNFLRSLASFSNKTKDGRPKFTSTVAIARPTLVIYEIVNGIIIDSMGIYYY